MKVNSGALKSMAAGALVFALAAGASADSPFGPTTDWSYSVQGPYNPSATSTFRSLFGSSFGSAPYSMHDTWRTVMIISAAVGIIGLISGDGTLVILGAAGVVVSLVETGGTSMQLASFHHGVDFMHTGPLSFGVGSLGFGKAPFAAAPQTGPYVQLSYRF